MWSNKACRLSPYASVTVSEPAIRIHRTYFNYTDIQAKRKFVVERAHQVNECGKSIKIGFLVVEEIGTLCSAPILAHEW